MRRCNHVWLQVPRVFMKPFSHLYLPSPSRHKAASADGSLMNFLWSRACALTYQATCYFSFLFFSFLFFWRDVCSTLSHRVYLAHHPSTPDRSARLTRNLKTGNVDILQPASQQTSSWSGRTLCIFVITSGHRWMRYTPVSVSIIESCPAVLIIVQRSLFCIVFR